MNQIVRHLWAAIRRENTQAHEADGHVLHAQTAMSGYAIDVLHPLAR
jgi:hypothetical protein